nr:hypothetical protein [Halomarina rubra]
MILAYPSPRLIVGRHLGRGVHRELDVLVERDERIHWCSPRPLVDLVLIEVRALDFDFDGQVLEDGICFSEVLEAEEDSWVELGSDASLEVLDVDAARDSVDGDADVDTRGERGERCFDRFQSVGSADPTTRVQDFLPRAVRNRVLSGLACDCLAAERVAVYRCEAVRARPFVSLPGTEPELYLVGIVGYVLGKPFERVDVYPVEFLLVSRHRYTTCRCSDRSSSSV